MLTLCLSIIYVLSVGFNSWVLWKCIKDPLFSHSMGISNYIWAITLMCATIIPVIGTIITGGMLLVGLHNRVFDDKFDIHKRMK